MRNAPPLANKRDEQLFVAEEIRTNTLAWVHGVFIKLRKQAQKAGLDVAIAARPLATAMALIEKHLPTWACPLCEGGDKRCECKGTGWFTKLETRKYALAKRRTSRPEGMKGMTAKNVVKHFTKHGRKSLSGDDMAKQIAAEVEGVCRQN